MSRIECSEWLAFVHDDDDLSPDHVIGLLEESSLDTLVEAVYFAWRMDFMYVLPRRMSYSKGLASAVLQSKDDFWKLAFGLSLNPQRFFSC